MKVEIWSDIICPFCYIGKRNIETVLSQFPEAKSIEIEWKSFQLDPTFPQIATDNHEEYLAKRKGFPVEQVKVMLQNVTNTAKQAGLDFHLEQSVIVNSYNAHRLIQFAKTKGLGDEAEERFFKAYFTEGKDMANLEILTALGKEIGLDEEELQVAFTDNQYAEKVNQDIDEARAIGVTGVPFFVFDRKYAISGAQPPQAFLQALEKSFGEWQQQNPKAKLEVSNGESCDVDGNCE
ncbi:protein disulfide-isomerase [Flavobacterium arsenatis]|uniref:Protein disulfide-isomerase n=1 Tax=Flavobacterium arsenatis TaxID=1484332 RepID=A0ABU1TKB6_9FLAO|nr:DsbA family oxidoreductase [Flavobacterium arsenatis]MDR6966419.1 protein disulfide-isomerase [Flavobacterium arsenatis]